MALFSVTRLQVKKVNKNIQSQALKFTSSEFLIRRIDISLKIRKTLLYRPYKRALSRIKAGV